MSLAVSLLATPRYTLPQIDTTKQSLRAGRCAKKTGQTMQARPVLLLSFLLLSRQ